MGAKPQLCYFVVVVSVGLLTSCQPAQTSAQPSAFQHDACLSPTLTAIHFPGGNTQTYFGGGPFFFGTQIRVGDWNKNPWAVDPHYGTELTIRGHRIDGPDIVNFGYWPTGYGTPSQLPDMPVSFSKQDSEGRTNVFQAEIRIAPQEGGEYLRQGAQFWSFPTAGCYVIEAIGLGVDEGTNVTVRT